MADVDLNLLGELVQRIHDDVRALRERVDRMAGDLADIKDELLVQGAILVKLETGAAGPDSARMLQMLQRLQRRIEALEPR